MLHHIAYTRLWEQALEEGQYRWSTLDKQISEVGYLHCSDSIEQAQRVARFLFGDVREPLCVLGIDQDVLIEAGFEIRFESASEHDPSTEKFPHVYGGNLPLNAVRNIRRFPNRQAMIQYLL